MVPILLSNEELVNNILESLNDKQKYVGLLFAEETEEKENHSKYNDSPRLV